MHKKTLGLSSILMAGMLAVSSVSPAAVTAYATEPAETLEVVASEDETTNEKKAEEVVEETPSEEKESEVEDKEAKEEVVEETKEDEEPSEEAKDEEAPAEEAQVEGPEFFGRWNQSQKVKGKLEFTEQYQEFCYDLGQTYNTADFKSVTVKVADQGNNICIKLYDADMKEKQAGYSNYGAASYTVAPTYDGTVRYIGIMSMPEGEESYPYSVTVKEITVDATPAVPSPGSGAAQEEGKLVFNADNLALTNHWTGKESSLELKYEAEWEEYWFPIGETLDAEKIKSVTVTFKEPTLNLAFKLYDDNHRTSENKATELEPFYGQSGKSSYTIFPTASGEVTHFAIMAMNQNEFPASATLESVEFVVDTTPSEPVEKGVEYDIVDLRDPMTAILGEDFIIGTAISYMEFADQMEMELVTKHFNGVTLGNELKPDSMIKQSAPIITYNLNGEDIQVPELNYDTPERYLDFFVDWNNEHPDKKIRVRGHVLVWHSQTPEFFFHEDYDESKPLVTPDVMNKRLEYYIKSVATHFTADDSKYKDLFYGWDVVNEAISDGTGTYRNDSEHSSWWAVYHSPEFIQNAFVYANKYMPASIALFYNDYNEYVTSKVEGICELLRTVKATPGARIDGMGMQAHYQVAAGQPSMAQFKAAARAYSEIVDQIQVTELDYKGSANSKDERLAERYKELYDTIRRLMNEGVNFTGMTIWGVVDKHSWLQNQNSNGGGSDGSARQYPLLFDDNYKAKNAFWALVNAGELEPEKKEVTLVQKVGNHFKPGNSYEFSEGETKATFIPMWEEGGKLFFNVSVVDNTVDDTDCFTIYVDDGNRKKSMKVTRESANATDTGYQKIKSIYVDEEALKAGNVKIDVAVTDGEKTFAFGDTSLNQNSKYFAETSLKPALEVKKGTVVIDGDLTDEAWNNAEEVPLTINLGADVSANAKLLWDEKNLYVRVEVKDAVLNKASSQAHEQDSLEVFIDENNHKSTSYEEDDNQYRINYENEHSFNGKLCEEKNVESVAKVTEDGYVIEAAFKWTSKKWAGSRVGLELQINDANEKGTRSGTLSWADTSGNGWSSPEVFGTVRLAE